MMTMCILTNSLHYIYISLQPNIIIDLLFIHDCLLLFCPGQICESTFDFLQPGSCSSAYLRHSRQSPPLLAWWPQSRPTRGESTSPPPGIQKSAAQQRAGNPAGWTRRLRWLARWSDSLAISTRCTKARRCMNILNKWKCLWFCILSYQEESLYFGNSFPQPSSQVVSDSSQQDPKEWDANQSIENTEQLPAFGLRRGVSETWTWDGCWSFTERKIETLQGICLMADPPMVVMIVPEKKKALARSHWLT